MIQMQTILDVADNTGAKLVRTIRVLGPTHIGWGSLGDIVVCSIQKAIPGAPEAVRHGKVVKGVIVRCRKATRRADGSYVRFDSNAIVLIDADNNPRGTRFFGAVARELREKKFTKILSLASEVV